MNKMEFGVSATPVAETRLTSSIGLQWVVFTILGSSLGSLIANAAARPMPDDLTQIVGWTVAGICVGAAQWVVLRRQLRAARWWVLGSAVGWLLGTVLFVPGGTFLYFLVALLTGGNPHFFSGPDNGLAVGLSVGFVQWLLLRRELTGAGWWVVATALAWTLFYIPQDSGPASINAAIVLGILSGSLTGIVLVWKIGKPSGSMPTAVEAAMHSAAPGSVCPQCGSKKTGSLFCKNCGATPLQRFRR